MCARVFILGWRSLANHICAVLVHTYILCPASAHTTLSFLFFDSNWLVSTAIVKYVHSSHSRAVVQSLTARWDKVTMHASYGKYLFTAPTS